jgi:hypothetical protein
MSNNFHWFISIFDQYKKTDFYQRNHWKSLEIKKSRNQFLPPWFSEIHQINPNERFECSVIFWLSMNIRLQKSSIMRRWRGLSFISEYWVSSSGLILKDLIDWKRYKEDFYLNVNVLIRGEKLPLLLRYPLPGNKQLLRYPLLDNVTVTSHP